jgi:hypothetical protein
MRDHLISQNIAGWLAFSILDISDIFDEGSKEDP